MLYEFAVDPSAVSRWEPFRYVTDHAGAENGRLIARLPKRWEDAVLRACSACGPVEKKKITERLVQIKNRLTRSGRPYDHGFDWLRNAEDQHAREPFRAIISTRNPNGLGRVLLAPELDDDTQHWNVPRELRVARDADAMAACVEGFFAHSKEILFVDPHFAPEHERYRATLSEFITVAHRGGKRFARIEYHLKKASTQPFFENACRTELCHRLPQGVQITFIRWREMATGEELHPRYILSEIGGVRFERGLDSGGPGQTVDVSLLSEALRVRRWENYQKATTAFDYQDEVSIVGTV
jgi:hypothetical protein